MIKVSVFGRKECDACKAAVQKITYFSEKWGQREATSIDFIDMETVDGLAEGAYRDVYDIPTVILEEEGKELVRWVKKVPASREFRDYFMRETLDDGSGDKRFC
jgi:thiol-disulfide isomerase/thioredoxin